MASELRRDGGASAKGRPLSVGLRGSYSDAWVAGVIYVTNVMRCLETLPPESRPQIVLLEDAKPVHDDLKRLANHCGCEIWSHDESSVPSRLMRRVRRLTGLKAGLPNARLDVIFPAGEADATDPRRLYWMPDFQHEHMPELFAPQELASRRSYMAALAKIEGHILLSSETAAADFRRFYPDAMLKAHVWSFPSSLDPGHAVTDASELAALPPKYLYIANQFWAHKDHETALRALAILKDRGIDADLVCTGHENDPRRPDHMANLRTLVRDSRLTDRVRFLGLVPRAVQIEIFRRAAAVVQPSRFEGWSTVVEDARSLGKDVILSNIPVHREQMPDAHLFETGNPASLANVIARVLDGLKPGPDVVREREAQAALAARCKVQAQKLLGIFHEVASR